MRGRDETGSEMEPGEMAEDGQMEPSWKEGGGSSETEADIWWMEADKNTKWADAARQKGGGSGRG